MLRLGVGGAIFVVAGLLSVRDLYSSQSSGGSVEASDASSPSDYEPKLKSRFMVPTLKFLYCRVFNEYAGFIRERYPSVEIQGDNYPPPPLKAMVAQIMSFAKIILIVMVLSGQDPFALVGLDTPAFWTWATTNKMYACMMLFFVSNAVEGQMISTGAFEVSYNDVPVWSKLETGRVPAPQELMQILDSQMRMGGGAGGGAAGTQTGPGDRLHDEF